MCHDINLCLPLSNKSRSFASLYRLIDERFSRGAKYNRLINHRLYNKGAQYVWWSTLKAGGRLLCILRVFGGSCAAPTNTAQLLTSAAEVLPLVSINEGVDDTVEDPQEYQPARQVKAEVRGDAETIPDKINMNLHA